MLAQKLAFLFLVFVNVYVTGASQAVSKEKPNIIFILADDLGYGDIGCYGQQIIRTPNIDKLAAGGMRFTDFYAGTSVCAPSRAAFFTGKHTGHTDIRGNYEVQPEGQFPISDSAHTIAEMFKNAGYKTGCFGKWGMGFVGSSGDPLKQGFDQFFGYNCQRQSHNYFPGHLWNGNKKIELDNTAVLQKQYAPDLIQQQAVNFLDSNKANPFFIYLSYTLPHAGLQLPEGDTIFDGYKKTFNEQPLAVSDKWNAVGYQPQAYPHAAYAAMVTRLDNYVGEIIKKVNESGNAENTLIVFTSDNGPHREGGNDPGFFKSSGNFRGIKRSLFEGGIRVPMIASWPTKIKPFSQSALAAASWDFMATFSQIISQQLPGKQDGISLLPTLTGKGVQKLHDYLYWEFHEDGGRQAVRTGKWKGVRENVLKNSNGPIQLFDLSTDPAETKDVAATFPLLIAKMKKAMQEAHIESKNFPFTH